MLTTEEKIKIIRLIKSKQLPSIDLALTLLGDEFGELEMGWGGLLLGERDLIPITCMVGPYRPNVVEGLDDITFDSTLKSSYRKTFREMMVGPMYLLRDKKLYKVLKYQLPPPNNPPSAHYIRLNISSKIPTPQQ